MNWDVMGIGSIIRHLTRPRLQLNCEGPTRSSSKDLLDIGGIVPGVYRTR